MRIFDDKVQRNLGLGFVTEQRESLRKLQPVYMLTHGNFPTFARADFRYGRPLLWRADTKLTRLSSQYLDDGTNARLVYRDNFNVITMGDCSVLFSAVNMVLPTFAAERRAAAPLLLGARRCQSISPVVHTALSSKPAARRFCDRLMGQTDGWTDGHPTVT